MQRQDTPPPHTDDDAPSWMASHRERKDTSQQDEPDASVLLRLIHGRPAPNGTRPPLQCAENVVKVLRLDLRWAGRLRRNKLGLHVELDGEELNEARDVMRVREWMADVYGLHPGGRAVLDAILAAAEDHAFHPVERWLGELPPWDGQHLVDRVAAEVLGVDSDLARLYLRRFMVGAVARILSPGCKLDTALILIGGQGVRKSSFFRVLFGQEWFGDSPIPIGDKDAYLMMARCWGFEAAELESLRVSTAEKVKQFLSSSVDVFRPPYGRTTVSLPRRSVLCGTTNAEQFLVDPTGARRFWLLTIPTGWRIDTDRLSDWRTRLWAEALAAYRDGVPWWLDPEQEQHEQRQADLADAHETDPWTDKVIGYAADHPAGVSTLDVYLHLNADVMGDSGHNTPSVDRCGKSEANRIGAILRAHGYRHQRVRDGATFTRNWRKT
jgi:putative DNA primase/helicase